MALSITGRRPPVGVGVGVDIGGWDVSVMDLILIASAAVSI